MKVLALTHAHLHKEGLSPVSCERADSIVGTWGEHLGWNIDVIYTKNTKWNGIWPGGNGLKANILELDAPGPLMMGYPELFASKAKELIANKKYADLGPLIRGRITKKIRASLAANGFVFPHEIVAGKKWGTFLTTVDKIRNTKYDFIFVCIGYGDEYLLQTGLTLSKALHAPMIVDFRDLWSDNHFAGRFTEKQRKIIRKYEIRLLSNTILLSVPQKPMGEQLRKYLDIPVHVTAHSAHIDKNWQDGMVVADEFRMLYAGKLYSGNPGQKMILDLLKKLSIAPPDKPVRCHFYIDDTEVLKAEAKAMGLEDIVEIHSWVSPSVLWSEMRSAHVLLTFDAGVPNGMPLLMTKTIQYAATGRPILALCKYGNKAYEDFFKEFDAGVVCTNADDAFDWVTSRSRNARQYESMPDLKKVPNRTDIALAFGQEIETRLRGIVS